MKTFALISDLHGNLPALQSIKEDLERYPVDQVIALGDYIAPLASPLETLNTLEAMNAIIILGNSEERVIKLRAGRLEELRATQGWLALFRADEETKNYNYSELPFVKTIEAEGKRLILTHATPDSVSDEVVPDEYVSHWRSRPEFGTNRLNEILKNLDADYWLAGHTHRSFVHSAYGKTVVNPGSAGLTRNNYDIPLSETPPSPDFGKTLLLDYIDSGKARFSPYTQYARITVDRDYLTVIFRTLQYDYRKTIQDLIDCGLAENNRAWSRLAVQEFLTGRCSLMPFIELVMRLQRESGFDQSSDDSSVRANAIWNEAERLFPFQIPPIV